jgi:uncharacterized protein DUF3995
MTQPPAGFPVPAPIARSRTATWVAYAACACALSSAAVSFYWVLGGTVGVGTLGGTLEELARAGDARAITLGLAAGLLKAAGGVLALALVRPWGRRVPRRLLLTAAWGAYGAVLVAAGALVLSEILDPAGLVDRTALWWRVLVWDLWFLIWGVLLGAAARQYQTTSRTHGPSSAPG